MNRTITRTWPIISFVGTLIMSTLASAEPPLETRFKELDKNGDGKITREEAPQLFDWLRAADTNGDGALTLDEIRDYLRQRGISKLQPGSATPAPSAPASATGGALPQDPQAGPAGPPLPPPAR